MDTPPDATHSPDELGPPSGIGLQPLVRCSDEVDYPPDPCEHE